MNSQLVSRHATRSVYNRAIFFVLVVACLCPTQVFAQNIFSQRAVRQDIFMQPPRSVSRLLAEGKSGLNDARYSDAFSALYEILCDEVPRDVASGVITLPPQDYFLTPDSKSPKKASIRREADSLLALLPGEAAEALELQFGVIAQQELEKALQSRDLSALASVARNFPHTNASYKAFGALAARAIADGESILATRHLDRLCAYPRARKLFGSDLVLNCALLHQANGRETRAVELMTLSGDWFPGQSVTLDGQQIPLSTEDGWAQRLRSAVKDRPVEISVPAENWSTAGGSLDRNAISKIGLPIPTVRWSKRIHSNSIELSGLNSFRQANEQAKRFLLPRLELRVANNTVFTKTTDDVILAVDLESGLSKYEMYRWAAAVQLTGSPGLLTAEAQGELSAEVRSRVWGSPGFGRFSCDDEYLYAVRELPNRSSGVGFRGQPISTNFLAAYHIKSEGGVAWNSGGSFENAPSIKNSPLTGAFFMGPPISHDGKLFCIIEQRSLVELVVLDRESGDLLWRQQLCNSLPRGFGNSSVGKQALSPTISDGVVICPTGRGAVVAVDLTTRQFLWANVYNEMQQATFRGRQSASQPRRLNEVGWQDSRIVVGEGYVAFTPSETEKLFAYDLISGRLVLPGNSRNRARYIGGIHDGEVIVVAEQRTVGFSLQNRRTRIGAEFPNDSHLVGRGIWMGDEMLLPLSDRRVARVKTSTGETLEEVQVDRRLGNLFAYKGQLLVVNESSVNAYFTREALEEDLDAENPSFQQLNRRAQVALANDDPTQAIQLLRQALDIAPGNSESAYNLIQAILDGLDDDYSAFRPIAEEFEHLVSEEQRFKYLRRIVEGDMATGMYREGISRLLQMLDDQLPDTPAPRSAVETYAQLDESHRVDHETWIRTNLVRVYSKLNDTDRQDVDELISQRLPGLAGASIYKRQKLLNYFTSIPAAHGAILRLARDLQKLGEFTRAESFLIPLLSSPDEQIATEVKSLLATPCNGEFRKLTPIGEMVHNRLQATTQPVEEEALIREQLADLKIQWPSGRLEDSIGSQHYQYGSVVRQESQRFGRRPVTVAIHSQSLVLYNANGEMVARPPFVRDLDNSNVAFSRATIHGGLLLVETLTEVAAFDIQRALEVRADSMLWRLSLRNSGRFEPSTVTWGRNKLGQASGKRSLPQQQIAVVGQLTEYGLPLQLANKTLMLDPWTGKTLWSRSDIQGNVRFAVDGERLAVSVHEGNTTVLDARDGTLIDKVKGIADNTPWLVKGKYLLDYQRRYDGSGGLLEEPIDLVAWNPFTGKQHLQIPLVVGSRADVHGRRYATIVSPDNKLHLLDLDAIDEHGDDALKSFNVETNEKIDSVTVERLGDSLLVMSNASDREKPYREVALYRPTAEPDDRQPIHGFVYAIDLNTQELAWSQPAELFNMEFPRIQPRNTPYAVTYFYNEKSRLINLAIIDMRDGTLGFAASFKNLTNRTAPSIVCRSMPAEGSFSVDIDTRNFKFLATDAPRPPQPVVHYKSR